MPPSSPPAVPASSSASLGAEPPPPPPPPSPPPSPPSAPAGSRDRPSEEPSVGPPAKRPRKLTADARGKTPDEILSLLQPPGCKLGMSFTDCRFTVVWKEEQPHLKHPYSQVTFTRSFAQRRGWVESLKEVRSYSWKKWGLLKHNLPLAAGEEEQEPGVVPQEILDLLEPTVQKIAEAKKAAKKAAKTEKAT